jgi:predicted O-methyltransferase YrrM
MSQISSASEQAPMPTNSANGASANARKLKRYLLSNAAVRTSRPILKLFGTYMVQELFYQNMFHHAAAASGLTLPALFPVQSAANYSLLYTILRAVTDLPVRSVLEIGAGQSTLVLDALAQRNPELAVTTVETDPSWAQRIGSRVSHAVQSIPLARKSLYGRETLAYTDLSVLGDRRYDLIVVDGPMGTKRHSRWAALEVLERCLGEQFLVIFDDAGRRGESDTICEFMRRSSARVGCRTIRAAKTQFLVFSPQFGAAEYF